VSVTSVRRCAAISSDATRISMPISPASFRKETNADDWAETRADIERLLRRYDETALPQEFIRLFRPGVDPAAWQGSARQWLARVDDLLRP
jgi:hypothetical protein